MRGVERSVLIWILQFEIIRGWLVSFDVVPGSVSLETCRVNYWTGYGTECMEGCSVVGELRHGPNYLSGGVVREFPDFVGISCRLEGAGAIFGGRSKKDYWMRMDVCARRVQSLAEELGTELRHDSRGRLFENSELIGRVGGERGPTDSVYVGAYHMSNTIGEMLRYKHTFYRYLGCSLAVDLLLVCLLVVNSLVYKYRLIRLSKTRKEEQAGSKEKQVCR